MRKDILILNINMNVNMSMIRDITVIVLLCVGLGLGCTASTGNCVACNSSSSPSSCVQCDLGYGLSYDTSIYQNICTNCTVSNCRSCSSNSSLCNICETSYTLDNTNSNCLPCGSNCQTCNIYPTCSLCDTGYTMNISNYAQCLPCGSAISNCQTCSQSSSACLTCLPHFVLLSPYCYACPALCDTCSSTTTCTQCLPTAVLNSSDLCEPCSDFINNCATCSDNQTCLTCSNGATVNRGSCGGCNDPNCLRCWSNNTSYCTRCILGTGFDLSSLCLTCSDAHCYNCRRNYLSCTRCDPDYGLVTTNSTCLLCSSVNCLICSTVNLDNCTSCVGGYALQGSICVACVFPCLNCTFSWSFSAWVQQCSLCSIGYAFNVTGQCQACETGCRQCDANNYQLCTVCLVSYYLSSSTCTLCSTPLPNCLQCTSNTYCTLCLNSTFLNPNHQCETCPAHCSTCDRTSTPYCTSCVNNYFYLNRTFPQMCLQVCGDSMVFDLPCDLGMGTEYDGCADNCVVQDGFQCNHTLQDTSICSYYLPIQITITSITREQLQNRVTIKSTIWPPLHLFQSSDLSTIFRIQNMTTVKVQYNPINSQLIIVADFHSHFWNVDVVVEFVPDQSIDARYFASVYVEARHRVQLFAYSEITFTIIGLVKGLSYGIVVVAITGAVAGIFIKKLAGLQALIACQLCLLSIIWINTDLLDPFTKAQPLQILLGPHSTLFKQSSETSRLLQQSQSMGPQYEMQPPYTTTFNLSLNSLANNYNFLLFLQILAFIAFLIITVLIKWWQRRKSKLMQQLDPMQVNDEHQPDSKYSIAKNRVIVANTARQFTLQLLLYIGMVNIVPFTVCCCIFFKYSNNLTDLYSLIFIALTVALYACTWIMFKMDPDCFKYFRYEFKRQPLALAFYVYYFVVLILSVVLLVTVQNYPYIAMIPIGVLLLFMVGYRPHCERMELVRSVFNLLTVQVAFGLRVFLWSQYKQTNKLAENPIFLWHLGNLTLMLLLTVIAIVYFIHNLIYLYYILPNKDKSQKQQIMQELEQINVRQQMINYEKKNNVFNQLLTPRMNVLDFCNGVNPNYCARQHQYQPEIIKDPNPNPKNNDSPNQTNYQALRKRSLSDQKDQQQNQNKIKLRDQFMLQQKLLKKQKQKKKQQKLQKQYKNKQDQIDDLKYKIATKQIELTEKQKKQRNKKICAMQIIVEESTWVRFKNARDYTENLKSGRDKNSNQYMNEYDQI